MGQECRNGLTWPFLVGVWASHLRWLIGNWQKLIVGQELGWGCLSVCLWLQHDHLRVIKLKWQLASLRVSIPRRPDGSCMTSLTWVCHFHTWSKQSQSQPDLRGGEIPPNSPAMGGVSEFAGTIFGFLLFDFSICFLSADMF